MIMEKDLTSLQAFGGVQGMAEALDSDMVDGLPDHEEDLHLRCSAILKPESEAHNRRFIHFLGKSCNSCTILLLLILAILLSAFGIKENGLRTGWYEGALTLGAVILIVMVHSVREYRNESSRQLSRYQPWQNRKLKVHVLRGGYRQTICISDVLLGDIVILEKGDQVPADGLLIPTESLEVNDEADPIIDDQNPFLFYGSKVSDGTGKMLVTSVGAETKLGNMLSRAQPSKRTPVEEQLTKLSTSTKIIGIVISISIIVVSFLWFELKNERAKSGLPDFSGRSHTLKGLYEAIKRVALRPQGMLTMLTSSFTLLLVGIAEGLPLAITIAITCWNKRMLGDKTCTIMFVQEPSVTVTIPSVTIICTDKTGGLALIPQGVERCCIGGKDISEDSKILTVIENFREAGVKVLLVSREEVSIEDIATAFGVTRPDADARFTTGEGFRSISDEDKKDMAARISVMGNSLPSDQLLLLSYLKDLGHTVAVVGSRTNDGPMLKAADVGLTFETCSTDIARKCTDIVIKEGNLTSILAIMKCGRCLYSNIRKYIQFQLTMTLAAGLVPLITNASYGSSPITTIQFHWAISVLTPLGGVALLMDQPGDILMKKFTPGAYKQLITKAMWVNIIIQTACQTSLLAIIQCEGPRMLRLSKKVTKTLMFNSFFLFQVFNLFNAREPEKRNIFRGVHRSKGFWVGSLTALLSQVAFLEIAHIIADDTRLTYAEWGMCLLLGIISWCIDLTGKSILLMSKSWATKRPGAVVRDNRNVNSALPEPASNLELPLMQEVEGPSCPS